MSPSTSCGAGARRRIASVSSTRTAKPLTPGSSSRRVSIIAGAGSYRRPVDGGAENGALQAPCGGLTRSKNCFVAVAAARHRKREN